jgi:hypothetical protein
MLDSGSSLSFVRRDVCDKIKELRLPYAVEKTEERRQTANGGSCDVTQAASLRLKYIPFHGSRIFDIHSVLSATASEDKILAIINILNSVSPTKLNGHENSYVAFQSLAVSHTISLYADNIQF